MARGVRVWEATFPAFQRDAHLELHADKSPGELLELFQQLREESLRELDALGVSPELLERQGSHPDFGTVKLSQLFSTWVVHDLAHSRQIFRAMAKRYREAIGPWRRYLRVMEE